MPGRINYPGDRNNSGSVSAGQRAVGRAFSHELRGAEHPLPNKSRFLPATADAAVPPLDDAIIAACAGGEDDQVSAFYNPIDLDDTAEQTLLSTHEVTFVNDGPQVDPMLSVIAHGFDDQVTSHFDWLNDDTAYHSPLSTLDTSYVNDGPQVAPELVAPLYYEDITGHLHDFNPDDTGYQDLSTTLDATAPFFPPLSFLADEVIAAISRSEDDQVSAHYDPLAVVDTPEQGLLSTLDTSYVNDGPLIDPTLAANIQAFDDNVTSFYDWVNDDTPYQGLLSGLDTSYVNDGPLFPTDYIPTLYSSDITSQLFDWVIDDTEFQEHSQPHDVTAQFFPPPPDTTNEAKAANGTGQDDVAALFPDTVDWTEWQNDTGGTLDPWPILAPPNAPLAVHYPYPNPDIASLFVWEEFTVENDHHTTMDATAAVLFQVIPPFVPPAAPPMDRSKDGRRRYRITAKGLPRGAIR